MRRIAAALAVVLAVFLIVRSVVEIPTIDDGDPSSYAADWGGPSLLGVLAVHCLPGVIAAVALIAWWRRRHARP